MRSRTRSRVAGYFIKLQDNADINRRLTIASRATKYFCRHIYLDCAGCSFVQSTINRAGSKRMVLLGKQMGEYSQAQRSILACNLRESYPKTIALGTISCNEYAYSYRNKHFNLARACCRDGFKYRVNKSLQWFESQLPWNTIYLCTFNTHPKPIISFFFFHFDSLLSRTRVSCSNTSSVACHTWMETLRIRLNRAPARISCIRVFSTKSY